MTATYLPFLIAGVGALAVFLLINALLGLKQAGDARKDVAARARGEYGLDDRAGAVRESKRSLEWLRESMSRLGEAVKPRNVEEISNTRRQLIQAGYRKENAVALYWGARCGLALLGLVGFGLFYALIMPDMMATHACFGAVLAMAAGMYLPQLWLSMSIAGRKSNFQDGLPDALDLLVVCVEAGMAMDMAVHRVGQEMQRTFPVVSDELNTLTLELRAGKLRRDALKSLAMRVGLDDMNSLVALLIQADMFGTSVAQTLRVYSDSMRTKRYQRAEETAAKLPVKMLFPMTICIFPALLLVLMGPAFLRLMDVLGNR